jgi:hypothetical protein
MFEEGMPPITRTTLYQVIKNLEKLEDIDVNDFFDSVEKAFNGYSYEGEDELVGQEKWPDLKQDGEYELPVRPGHEEAYELTLYVTCRDCKVTITNVL